MKKSCIIGLFILLVSCVGKQQQTLPDPPKELSKLEQLMLLPKDSVINYYDLSNDSLAYFPDLSEYAIKSLNLSHNQLDTLIIDCLPAGIEKLNLSYNLLTDIFRLEKKSVGTLKEVDVSHNYLTGVSIGEPLYRIIVSHNDITYTDFNHKNIHYLDISCNPNLSNRVDFRPSLIDTVIRKGIANNKPLFDRIEDLMTAPVY